MRFDFFSTCEMNIDKLGFGSPFCGLIFMQMNNDLIRFFYSWLTDMNDGRVIIGHRSTKQMNMNAKQI